MICLTTELCFWWVLTVRWRSGKIYSRRKTSCIFFCVNHVTWLKRKVIGDDQIWSWCRLWPSFSFDTSCAFQFTWHWIVYFSIGIEYCYFSCFLPNYLSSQQRSMNSPTSPSTQKIFWSLPLVPNVSTRFKEYSGKWLSVLEFSILRFLYSGGFRFCHYYGHVEKA